MDEPLCNSQKEAWLGTRHGDDVFKVFPWCPPVNLNPLAVNNHMDAVIICCD